MRQKTVALTDEVRDIIRRSTINGNVLVLPNQLARETYVAVDKALRAAGGRWKKGTGHVFDFDPSTLLGGAVEGGAVVDRKKTIQLFETPEALVKRMVDLLPIHSGMVVLEPSAGRGRIVKELIARGCKVVAIEPDERNQEVLAGIGPGLALYDETFEAYVKEHAKLRGLVDAVAMNPPFRNLQDADHIILAFKQLKPGGRLVAICSPSPFFRQTNRADAFRRFLELHEAEVHDLPPGTFKESGTEVAAKLIVIDKPRAVAATTARPELVLT